jgi:hypothetical protein
MEIGKREARKEKGRRKKEARSPTELTCPFFFSLFGVCFLWG